MILAAERAKDTAAAVRTLQQMKTLGMQPPELAYVETINACAHEPANVALAEDMLAQIKDDGLTPTVVPVNSFLNVLYHGREWERAYQLLRQMPKEGVQPDAVSYNVVIKALKDNEQWEQALELFDEMPSVGITPDAVTYTQTMSACGKGGLWQ